MLIQCIPNYHFLRIRIRYCVSISLTTMINSACFDYTIDVIIVIYSRL